MTRAHHTASGGANAGSSSTAAHPRSMPMTSLPPAAAARAAEELRGRCVRRGQAAAGQRRRQAAAAAAAPPSVRPDRRVQRHRAARLVPDLDPGPPGLGSPPGAGFGHVSPEQAEVGRSQALVVLGQLRERGEGSARAQAGRWRPPTLPCTHHSAVHAPQARERPLCLPQHRVGCPMRERQAGEASCPSVQAVSGSRPNWAWAANWPALCDCRRSSAISGAPTAAGGLQRRSQCANVGGNAQNGLQAGRSGPCKVRAGGWQPTDTPQGAALQGPVLVAAPPPLARRCCQPGRLLEHRTAPSSHRSPPAGSSPACRAARSPRPGAAACWAPPRRCWRARWAVWRCACPRTLRTSSSTLRSRLGSSSRRRLRRHALAQLGQGRRQQSPRSRICGTAGRASKPSWAAGARAPPPRCRCRWTS